MARKKPMTPMVVGFSAEALEATNSFLYKWNFVHAYTARQAIAYLACKRRNYHRDTLDKLCERVNVTGGGVYVRPTAEWYSYQQVEGYRMENDWRSEEAMWEELSRFVEIPSEEFLRFGPEAAMEIALHKRRSLLLAESPEDLNGDVIMRIMGIKNGRYPDAWTEDELDVWENMQQSDWFAQRDLFLDL